MILLLNICENRAEWRKVYKFAYSQDYEDQWQSLSRMLLWKTRYYNLVCFLSI